MKVLLLSPLKKYQVWAGVPDIFNEPGIYIFPPLGIMYLHAYLKQQGRHDARLLDCFAEQADYPEQERRIREFMPDVLAMTAHTHDLADVVETIRVARHVKPDIHIVLGGGHAWAFPEEAVRLPGVSAAIWGDGEITFADWVNALADGRDLATVPGVIWKDAAGEVHKNPNRPEERDLDVFPFPDRTAIRWQRYYTPATQERLTTTMITSRGCPNRCNFCSTHKNYRCRTPKNVVEEMRYLSHDIGVREIFFIDDTFNVTVDRVNEVSEAILSAGLKVKWGFKATCRNVTPEMLALGKRAGLVKIHYGVETGTDEGLRAMNKKATTEDFVRTFRWTREAKIRSIAYLMIGCPHERSEADVMATCRFVNEKLDPDYVVYALYSPYPDVPIFDEGVKKGLFAADCWLNWMRNPTREYDLPTTWEEFISKGDLTRLFKVAHRTFYWRPKTILRSVLGLKSPAELARLWRGGMSLVKMELLSAGKRI